MAVGRLFAYISADWISRNKFIKVSVVVAWLVLAFLKSCVKTRVQLSISF